MRANKSDDVSTIMEGYKDQYDADVKPDPKVDPTYNGDPDHPNQPDYQAKSNEALWIIIVVLLLIILLGACSVCIKRRDDKLTKDLDQQ